MITVKVRLFGAFRKYSNSSELELQVPQNSGLPEIRSALINTLSETHPNFSEQGLIFDSVFADESTILNENFKLVANQSLAILPPVCGG